LERPAHAKTQNLYHKAAFLLISLLVVASFTISVTQRIQSFAEASRLWQAGFILTIIFLFTMPLYSLLQKSWQGRAGWQAHLNRGKLAVALLLGLPLIGMLIWLPVHEGKILHTLEISLLAAPPAGPRVVFILEVRDDTGRVVSPADFRISGDWRIDGSGFAIQSDRPARLSYTFQGSGGADVQVLVKKVPDGGQVDFVVDQTRKRIDLSSPVEDHQVLTFTLRKTSRWRALVWIMDVLSMVGLLAASLALSTFVVSILPRAQLWPPRVNRRHVDVVFIVLFLVLLALPLLNSPGSLKELDRNFWQREQLVQSWITFRIRGLGDRVISTVYAANDHWLVFIGENSTDDYQNTLPVTDADLAAIQQNLDNIYEYCESRGVTFLFVVAPNKNTIYPEYMPAEIPVLGKQSLLDRLVEAQRASGKAPILDLRPALLAAKRERQVFFSNDTHWNYYGAWIGYQEIMRSLQKDFPALQPHPLDDYQEVSRGEYQGDMGYLTGHISLDEKSYQLKPEFLRTRYHWEATGFGADLVSVHYQPSADLPKMVMYRDSFGIALIPYLSNHFRQATYLTTYRVDTNFLDVVDPDIIIFEITERFLNKLIDPAMP